MNTIHKLIILGDIKNQCFNSKIDCSLRKKVLQNLFWNNLNNYVYVDNKYNDRLSLLRQYID
jgi:hypothetical protein